MSEIKRCWITEFSSGYWRLCIRYHPQQHYVSPSLSCDLPLFFPPVEEIDDKKLNSVEAKSLGLLEEHYTLGGFSKNDLRKIRDTIDNFLAGD